MEIVEFGLYNVKDEYFKTFQNNFLVDNKSENRPYYCSLKDNDGTIWFIPLSTQTNSYKIKIENDIKKHKKCLFYHIGTISGIERVFLIGNMFPVTEKYIKKPFTINNVHYVVSNGKLIKEIQTRAKRYLSLVKYNKLKPSVDIMKIKQTLLQQ